ncbi:hypothetical protein EBR04_10620, partial [bacterium]|nr:hypothetical protein [bacterium]
MKAARFCACSCRAGTSTTQILFSRQSTRTSRAPAGAGQPLRCFVIAWDRPADILAEYVRLTGRPALPPKWALGYMQSHRTLAGPEDVLDVAR